MALGSPLLTFLTRRAVAHDAKVKEIKEAGRNLNRTRLDGPRPKLEK